MKWIPNLFYTIWSKIFIVLLVTFFMLQTGICLADSTVMLRNNPVAVRNAFTQWYDYDYKTSEYLKSEIETAIDSIMQYSLYYKRDTINDDQLIVNADDHYRDIVSRFQSYKDFNFAIVNHTTNRVISDIPEINYQESSVNIRSYFPETSESLLIVRDAHNPFYETGTMTDYNHFITRLAEKYEDEFDLYIYFGEDFSFIADYESFQETHISTLARVKKGTRLSFVYIAVAALLFAVLLIVTGRYEAGGKICPGISDTLANDIKLLLFAIIIMSMVTLYKNSLYMSLRSESMDIFLYYSADFYILRSYVALLISSFTIMAACCTIKRQYQLGTLFTNTYIYKLGFAYKRDSDK